MILQGVLTSESFSENLKSENEQKIRQIEWGFALLS